MSQTLERPARAGNLLSWFPILASLLHVMMQVDMNYGTAYFLFDYRHGFVKRGLMGVPFAHIQHMSRTDARLIQLSILTLTFALTYWVFRKPLFSDTKMIPVTALLLAGPSLLPHLALMFIPTDPVLFAAGALSVWLFLNGSLTRAWLVSLMVCLVCLLVHEAFAIRVYPALLAIMLELCRRQKLRWSLAFTHLAIMMAACLAILHFGKGQYDPAAFAAEAVRRAEFVVNTQIFGYMRGSVHDERELAMRFVMNRGILQQMAISFLIAIPYAITVIMLLRRAMRAAGCATWQMTLTGVAFCAPLILLPVATDWMRWLSDCLICATLFLLYLYGADADDGPVRQGLRNFAQTTTATFMIAYVAAIGPFSGIWIESANFINHGYYDRFR